MQYWLYAFKWYHGDVLIGKYETLKEAEKQRDELNPNEYENASIVKMEWEKEPKLVSSMSFEYRKDKVKRKLK